MTMPNDSRPTGFGRREALRLLGLGAGLSMVADRAETDLEAASTQAVSTRPGGSALPRGAIIRTNLRDVDPYSINGHIMMHEHLLSPRYTLQWMVEEMSAARRHGIACMVSVG